MASGTYSQINIQIVFAVKGRASLIAPSWEERLYMYITGIIREKQQKLLAINGMPDHIHILIGMKPSCCLSDLVREIKKASNEFINSNKLSQTHFSWQEGFGAFSYSSSELNSIINYIRNQKMHHSAKTFKEEYTSTLKNFELEFKEEFLFTWVE